MFANIKEIDISALSEWIEDAGRALHVIDVRTPREFQAGSIEGAQNIPLHLIPLRIDELPTDKDLVFICRTGARSAQATAFANSRGLDQVFNLRGGLVDWVRNRLPVALPKAA